MVDVVVIGGGPSGMSAGLSASKLGASVLIVERENKLGGILNQCIHNGFGLKYFNNELTGPEYAEKLADMVKKDKNIKVLTETFVTKILPDSVEILNQNAKQIIKTKTIVLAMGCREKTAGAISLAGTRPAGVYTAGMVQKMINHYGKIPGKSAVILGSGDIGLIMCRRLIYEGVKVNAVLEIMPSSSGLARNVKQCVEDYNVPLLFNHTITQIVGEKKVEGIFYAEVDGSLNPIKSTEKFIKCDCVLLSVGLIPENDLVNDLIEFDKKTKGALVNEKRQTSTPNIFSSGNVLHIHDLADNATIEGEIAGYNAGLFSLNKIKQQQCVDVNFCNEISYVIPQKVSVIPEPFIFYFRVKNKIFNKKLLVKNGDEIIAEKYIRVANPGEMQEISVSVSKPFVECSICFGEVK